MKYYFLTLFLLLAAVISSYGIKPDRAYPFTPKDMQLQYEEKHIETSDKYYINSWHIPPHAASAKDKTIIISYGDSGNMSYWLSLAAALAEAGFDVWLYDYRGFGKSSDFAMNVDQLYYNEFLYDLSAVVDAAKQASPHNKICLFGLSMGTVINLLYVNERPGNVDFFVGEGIGYSPDEVIERLKATSNRNWILPDVMVKIENLYASLRIPVLSFYASDDLIYNKWDLEKIKDVVPQIHIINYESGHLGGLTALREKYIQHIEAFLN
jgi:predicted alpha/beta hydrolase